MQSISKIPLSFRYWGKLKRPEPDSTNDSSPYHLLVYHSLDVAAVCFELLDPDRPLSQDLASLLQIPATQLQHLFSFIVSLHDLGKFSSAFQALAPLQFPNLITPNCRKEYDGSQYRHDRLGAYFWWEIHVDNPLGIEGYEQFGERKSGAVIDALNIMMNCSLGHHGQPIDHSNVKNIKRFFTESQDLDAATEFAKEMAKLFSPELPLHLCQNTEWCKRLEQASWHLAGITVLADWVGSDQDVFIYNAEPEPLENYWNMARQKARQTLQDKELVPSHNTKPFTSIKDSFSFEPTPLQHWAETVSIDNQPQLFILEDVTGAGKTEAALALTHRLMAAGAADGFYFGLPTMATSNAMFGRIADQYLQMFENDNKIPSIILAHGAREMNERFHEALMESSRDDRNYQRNDSTATAECNQWIADSRKKALLAPVGVGTIDQALIAVLPRRHQSLRLIGLHRKVLIFDEVHAADEYMLQLLESLLQLHLHQGGSAILLTATLSLRQRVKLVETWQRAVFTQPQLPQKTGFPLATKVSVLPTSPLVEEKLESRADVSREVAVKFIHGIEDCVNIIVAAVELGQCVVWVRNSVDDAVDAYQAITNILNEPAHCLLFHSRFILDNRKKIENRVLKIFGKTSNKSDRGGKILIATQVFQESLDVDCDLLVSDICPIDDLIQRAGRLHRHTRNVHGEYQKDITDSRPAPMVWVHAPEWDENPESDWLSRNFLNTGYVYGSPGRLWLGMRELRSLGAIRMPGEARQLIESVYGDDVYDKIPQNLIHAENELIGTIRCREAKAKDVMLDWQTYGYSKSSGHWHEDNIEISTRFSERESVEVVLLKTTPSGDLVPWVGDKIFALQLSTVKLAKNTYSDRLQPLPDSFDSQIDQLANRYRQIKYRQCWLPELDRQFTYQPKTGFCKRQKQEEP